MCLLAGAFPASNVCQETAAGMFVEAAFTPLQNRVGRFGLVPSRRRVPSSQSSLPATIAPISDSSASTVSPDELSQRILETISSLQEESKKYAGSMVGFTAADASFYALFAAIRHCPDCTLGLLGTPFLLRHDETCQALGMDTTTWPGFFCMNDLEKAVQDDFLDAARGSTDNRKGWQVSQEEKLYHFMHYI